MNKIINFDPTRSELVAPHEVSMVGDEMALIETPAGLAKQEGETVTGADAVPPFPIHLMPQGIQRFARERQNEMRLPDSALDMLVIPAIITLASAWAGQGDVQIAGSFVQPMILFGGVIRGVSSMKSPTMSAATNVACQRNSNMGELHKVQLARWEGEVESYKLRKDMAVSQFKKDAKANPQLLNNPDAIDGTVLDEPEPACPLRPYAVLSDLTIEGLIDQWAAGANPLLTRDELAGILKQQGQYKGGGGDDRQKLLELYDGKPIAKVRKGVGGSASASRPRSSILGGIQPKVFFNTINRETDDGLVERFQLIGFGPDLPLRGFKRGPTAEDAQREYEAAYRYLADGEANSMADDCEPLLIPFTADAIDAFEQLTGEIADRWSNATGPFKARMGKVTGFAARLAFAFEIADAAFERRKVREVSARSVENACRYILEYQAPVWEILERGSTAAVTVESDADKLLAWIRNKVELGGTVSRREVARGGPKSVRKAERLAAAIEQLVNRGDLTVAEDGSLQPGER